MSRYDDEEDVFFELAGRIRRRGDDSRSPSPVGRRDRSRSGDRHDSGQSKHQQHRNTASVGSIISTTSLTASDTHTAQSLFFSSNRPPLARGGSDSDGSKPPTTIKDSSPFPGSHHPPTSAEYNLHDPPKVKEPSSDSDLTEDEFERYQARYGLRHKTSASQILQGTSDEDAEDPTLGNHRTQMRLSEDGTIERRDFDWRGGFRYDLAERADVKGRGKGKDSQCCDEQ